VVLVAPAVKNNLFDVLLQELGAEQFTQLACRLDAAPFGRRFPKRFAQGGKGAERFALKIIDRLGIKMFSGTKN
jgi:hypothetical protein